jgi:hypothetical protein
MLYPIIYLISYLAISYNTLLSSSGWFHEVRSSSNGSEGHLAFNYWFHPPDGDSFEKPYATDFWPDDWKKRNLH